jgi:hypothetical protein
MRGMLVRVDIATSRLIVVETIQTSGIAAINRRLCDGARLNLITRKSEPS